MDPLQRAKLETHSHEPRIMEMTPTYRRGHSCLSLAGKVSEVSKK